MAYNYERLGQVCLPTTLDLIRQCMAAASHPLEKHRTLLLGVSVIISSQRLRTFACHGTTCSHCGLHADQLVVERCRTADGQDDPKQPWQLNLYGRRKDGTEVLFTQDHTVARALGGADDLSNTTPMCERCNARKAQAESDAVLRARNDGTPLRGQGKRGRARLVRNLDRVPA